MGACEYWKHYSSPLKEQQILNHYITPGHKKFIVNYVFMCGCMLMNVGALGCHGIGSHEGGA